MHAGGARVVDAHDWDPAAQRQLLDLHDLPGRHLSRRAAEHAGVVGVDGDLPAVEGAEAPDHLVAGEQVQLDEASAVEQPIDPLARNRPAALHQVVAAPAVLIDLLLGGAHRLDRAGRPLPSLRTLSWHVALS
jgi:hypothetical protein